MLEILSALFGLIMGSFLNVCISRIPREASIIRPGSACPVCKSKIKFYDNIPVFSYIILGGKCRHCRSRISMRYPVVEILTSIITVLMILKWKSHGFWLSLSLVSSYILIITAFMDFETFLIADAFSYGLIFLGLVFSFFNPNFHSGGIFKLLESVSGAAAGAAIIWLLAFIGKKIYKKEAVGEGDIFLMAGIGAVVGWQGVVTTLVLASFFGSIYGLSLMALKKAGRFDHIPFGPFLALAAIINIYFLIKPAYFLMW